MGEREKRTPLIIELNVYLVMQDVEGKVFITFWWTVSDAADKTGRKIGLFKNPTHKFCTHLYSAGLKDSQQI